MLLFVWIVDQSILLSFPAIIKLFMIFCLGSSTWFLGAIILAVKIKSQDMFNTVYFLIITPITFTSSIYYPIESLPAILRPLGYINPLSWFTDTSSLAPEKEKREKKDSSIRQTPVLRKDIANKSSMWYY